MAVKYNSIEEYGQALYTFCQNKNLDGSICNDHKSGNKNHVTSHHPDGFSLEFKSNNLQALAQDYANNHLTINRIAALNAPSHLEIVVGETWSEDIHKLDVYVNANKTTVTNTTTFEVGGDASYSGVSVNANYNQSSTTEETDISGEVDASATKYHLEFKGVDNPYDVDFFTNKYTCGDVVSMDVTYEFSTITYCAVCNFSDGMAVHWNNEHYHATYDIANLGFDPIVTVTQDVVFNIDYDNPWPSYVITYK